MVGGSSGIGCNGGCDCRTFEVRGTKFGRDMSVEPKIGDFSPKMDGENKGKPYFLMDDLGENPLFLETSIWPGRWCLKNGNLISPLRIGLWDPFQMV